MAPLAIVVGDADSVTVGASGATTICAAWEVDPPVAAPLSEGFVV